MERVVLLVNHVIRAEPVAMARLALHASRTLAFSVVGWPTVLPAPPATELRITPAGLVEWVREPVSAPPDLQIAVEAANPALLLAGLAVGERPAMQVEGDAALAADVNWLVANLRWDIEDDLARIVGNAPAREIARFAAAAAAALRRATRGFDPLAARPSGAGRTAGMGGSGRAAAEPPSR